MGNRRWRIASYHPEDRYEPDDEVADAIRSQLSVIALRIKHADVTDAPLNKLLLEQRKLRIELSERLYGK